MIIGSKTGILRHQIQNRYDLGFRHTEIQVFTENLKNPKEAKKILSEFDFDYYSFHMPHNSLRGRKIGLGNYSESQKKDVLDTFKRTIDIAAENKEDAIIVLHVGEELTLANNSLKNKNLKTYPQLFLEEISTLRDYVIENKYKVKLGLEHVPPIAA